MITVRSSSRSVILSSSIIHGALRHLSLLSPVPLRLNGPHRNPSSLLAIAVKGQRFFAAFFPTIHRGNFPAPRDGPLARFLIADGLQQCVVEGVGVASL